MTDTALQTEWKKFADAIGGSISQAKESYFNPDNTYCIKTDKEEISLIWADKPAKGRGTHVNLQSVFRFRLKPGSTAYLKIYPKDLLTGLFSTWNKNRRRTEDPELDKAYIFIANEQETLSAVVYKLQQFHQQNKYRSFVIETENDSRTLLIQVNELLIQKEDLFFFYEFGKSLVEVL
ncbi:hypothetical protein OCK74_13500 [Chitinophagaceae bacterium LB-8]|uniref:Uncharacterized protein n=1 Tax=Paraflavisolibacter caeni TaxID=2982496 RepID=A0A9X3BIK7_9BACT|nr:hypothetical protein [Paraflavisolibacter caeni]MCU7550133.1 hypothetical protein [Paraflavisolibacter caeni]